MIIMRIGNNDRNGATPCHGLRWEQKPRCDWTPLAHAIGQWHERLQKSWDWLPPADPARRSRPLLRSRTIVDIKSEAIVSRHVSRQLPGTKIHSPPIIIHFDPDPDPNPNPDNFFPDTDSSKCLVFNRSYRYF